MSEACEDCRTFAARVVVRDPKTKKDRSCCYICAHDRANHPRGGKCSHTAADIYPPSVRRQLKRLLEAQSRTPQGTPGLV